jgi:hypothetical protein
MRRTGMVKTMPYRAVANASRVRLQRCRFGIVRASAGYLGTKQDLVQAVNDGIKLRMTI